MQSQSTTIEIMDFSKRYSKLNSAQKQAVDCIDGPVMVIAGPGTGKTELLSVRVANILQKTDALPENILCLTFTESGADAMRERLTEIIDKEAYKVAVHTFHSFGTEVINKNGQYFYQGAHFTPADELSSYEIIHDIFKKLPYGNPLAKKINDEFTYLPDAITSISEIKKSGLTSDELLAILDDNNAVIEKAEQLLSPIFDNRISKDTAALVSKHIPAILKSPKESPQQTIVSLAIVLSDSLQNATDEAIESKSTKPMTAWRNKWFRKDENGHFVLKSKERQVKLRALSFIYEQYRSNMEKAALYDFDDMILQVVHAMEVVDDLRFNLQEKYQYIMVDEFQDTNLAQMRILNNLTNNIVHEDTPNIMVVGDDDQAIYSFQGADISNILNFRDNYKKAKIITLTENYRSTTDILDGTRDIIMQGNDRLENIIDDIDKKLTSNNPQSKKFVNTYEADNIFDERHFIVMDIKRKIKEGTKPNDIAVLTRRHKEINNLLPYLAHHGIAVNYERRDNVLDIAPIKLLQQVSELLLDLFNGRHDAVNCALPEILAHPAWEIEPIELWKLSVEAYDKHSRWLDTMIKKPEFMPLANWIIVTSKLVSDTPLEQILDIIIGKNDSNEEYSSPIYKYYFSDDNYDNNPNSYLLYLESLRTIRSKLREYHPNQTPTLQTFVDFIALNRKIGNTISVIRHALKSDNAINVMTAHRSKGLEFDTVYVINAVDKVWGQSARTRNRLISYPENLPFAPAGETSDERLRLFYVASTRAKNDLNISYSQTDDSGKNTLKVAFLLDSKWNETKIQTPSEKDILIESTELAWYQPLVDPTTSNMRDFLLPMLEKYRLSVTHLNNFLDVTRGGPRAFLIKNLLRFPEAKSPNAAYGTAIHNTLQNAHNYLASTGQKQATEDIVSKFEKYLEEQHLATPDFQEFLQKGSDALQVFLEKKYDSFSTDQKTELDFISQHSIVKDAHITGKIDLANVDTNLKTMSVTDYKTGKPAGNWNGKTDAEKIKLHKYNQQLMFYKLLVENARDYRGYKVESGIIQFVEPTNSNEILSLETDFDTDELERFSKLVNAVWSRIIELDLPDTSDYDSTYNGILAFEQDLLDNS